MNIASVEASLHKFLFDNFEILLGIKVFESVYYVDFENYNSWIVIDSMGHTTGPIPRADFYLHLSLKNGLANEKALLNRLIDAVTSVINPYTLIDVYDDATEELLGQMEVVETSLLPVLQHAGGGCYRSLAVGLVYAGDVSITS